MPSDPSGVTPKGVLTRPAPDWFDDNIGTGGYVWNGAQPAGVDQYVTVGLYNDAVSGVALKVYAIYVSADGGGGFGFYFVKGPVGTLSAQCAPLRPDHGSPYGKIYYQQATVAANAVNPFNVGPYLGMIGSSGFDSFTVTSPFPLFIVPVGYTLVGTNVTVGSTVGVNFWYQQSNE